MLIMLINMPRYTNNLNRVYSEYVQCEKENTDRICFNTLLNQLA